jgi:hypothetical protein
MFDLFQTANNGNFNNKPLGTISFNIILTEEKNYFCQTNTHMRILSFTLFFFLLSLQLLEGQNKDTSGQLSLNLRSLAFFKNNEYTVPAFVQDKSAWIEGYTLTGFFFQPELIYKPSEKVSLRAGGHFLKYSGMTAFTTVRPVFSTLVRLGENTSLTLGTLSGSDDHRLFDPHFNKERIYNAFVEDGIQIKTNTKRIYNDSWISWENTIFKGDNHREVFTAGESFRYTSPVIAGTLNISLPLQVLFRHYGGQISDYPEPVETFVNLATGVKLGFLPSGNKFGKVSVEYVHYLNRTLPGRESDIVRGGNASYAGITWLYGKFSYTSSYWRAQNFYAPMGNGIFASVNDFNSGLIFRDREIFVNSFSFNLFPDSFIKLFLGVDTYYDIHAKKLDYAATVHLDLEKLIRIATFKQSPSLE